MRDQTDTSHPDRPSLLLGTAHLGALWALAIVQPMLSLLGGSPEFFVARTNTPGQIIVYVVTLTFGPPMLALLVEAVAGRVSRNLRWGIHLFLMALVGSLLALSVLKRYSDLPSGVLIGGSVVLAVLGAWAYSRFRFPRAFMDILTPAPIVLLLVFFFFSSASKVVLPEGDPEPVSVSIENPAPVLVIAFDEFPLVTLMDGRASIDGSRYPNFHALAAESNWYLNASSAGAYTPVALPALLTGQSASQERLPIAPEYPQSIFTLLGDRYHLNVHELVTQICPESLCPRGSRDFGYDSGTGALFSDLFVVSQHLLLPNSLREDLPDISKAFGGFGDDARETPAELDEPATEVITAERSARGGAREIGRVILGASQEDSEVRVAELIEGLNTGGRERLDLIHLLKPHYPWKHIPDGQRYTNLSNEWVGLLPDDREWKADQRVVDIATQRGLLEVGYTDMLFGRIRDALKKRGVWDETLVVVTADHGAGFSARVERRRAVRENLGWIGSIPLFIKAPGQAQGRVVRRHTCAYTVLPEIADQLGIDYPWATKACPEEEVLILNSPSGSTTGTVGEMTAQRNRNLARIQRIFTTGTGWRPVFQSGPRKGLIGRRVGDFRRLPPLGDQFAVPEERNAVKDFDPTAPALRGLLQRGPVRGLDEGEVLAIAVDGRIEAVGWTFRDRIRSGSGYSILLPPWSLERGFNRLDIYLVRDRGRALRLLYSGAGRLEEGSGPSGP